MLLLRVISSFLAIPLVAGFLVAPPAGSTPAPLTVSDCSGWVVVTSSMTCTSIATTYGISIAQFEAMVSSSTLYNTCRWGCILT
jgi:hypothetical protein